MKAILYLFFTLSLLFNLRLLSKKTIEIKSDQVPYALSNLHINQNTYAFMDPTIKSIRQLRVTQGYGDPTYKNFRPFANYRIYGFSGYVMSTITRQTIADEAIGLFLYPAPYSPDVSGKDINAHAKTLIGGSEALIGFFFNPFQGYFQNIYSIIEFSFTGTNAFNDYCATMRNFFGEITWTRGSFLFGQYYHPLFLKECFPRTVNGNQGSPFETNCLAPQIRVTHLFRPVEVTFTMLSQSYLASWGLPQDFVIFGIDLSNFDDSNIFIRDAIVPNMNINVKYLVGKSYYGFSFDYLRLFPTLSSSKNFKSNEYVNSISGEIFAHNVFSKGEINIKAIYSQNGSNQLMISGFAVKNVNPITAINSYIPTACVAVWLDCFYLFKKRDIEIGLFTGWTKNLGALSRVYIDPETNQPIVYSEENNISANLDHAARLSIRFVYAKESFRCGLELEYDKADFGLMLNSYAQPINITPVNAFSYIFSIDYVY